MQSNICLNKQISIGQNYKVILPDFLVMPVSVLCLISHPVFSRAII
ncbi:hypothetical protein C3B55_00163 [Candidatus Pseudomonas adelgestsugas]|uniref:Uncharacterized protein n=1 Tax=Candidatus Pseudomonas adelgestsugas TaxID=1302376 RepID=A0ABX5R7R8_9PSED|nr:hypothetical protein C3B55_00163 [Candidatus Pseudomonas adelgestsugas]